jgi:hypothetical protein
LVPSRRTAFSDDGLKPSSLRIVGAICRVATGRRTTPDLIALASLSMLEQITPTHPLVRQLRFELEMLRALPHGPKLIPR